ncbi:MAG: carboxypeptidase-like regulatory domain-containing protein, partial [Rufibacter sp.]
MKTLFLFPFFLLSFFAQAQTFKGQIVDQHSTPLEYVNIGVIGKNVGTVSTAQGTFSLTIPAELDLEVLQISAIGYKPLQFTVAEFKEKYAGKVAVLQLKEEAVALQEVVVRPKKYVTRVIGNKADSKSIYAGFKDNSLGSEVGVMLKIKKPAFLEKVTFNIASNKYDTLFLRINIYRMGKNGPEENILREPIYINLTKKEVGNSISLSLSDRNIHLDSDSFLSLELVRDLGPGGLWFSMGFLASPSYYR